MPKHNPEDDNLARRSRFWAGDGDDVIYGADNWRYGYGFGGRGDDTFHLPNVYETLKYYGGLGDDLFLAKDLGSAETNDDAAVNVLLSGGAGDDRIEGMHKV